MYLALETSTTTQPKDHPSLDPLSTSNTKNNNTAMSMDIVNKCVHNGFANQITGQSEVGFLGIRK